MDGKRIRCLQIVSLHEPIYLLPFLRYSEIFVKKSSFYDDLHSTPSLGVFPSEYRHPLWGRKTRMVSLPDSEKNFEDIFISFDVIHERVRQTDRRTDTAWMTAKTALASHRAVKIAISPAAKIGSTPNFGTVIEPRSWHRGWSRITKFKFKMAHGCHIAKCWKRYNSPISMDRCGRNLGGRIIPSVNCSGRNVLLSAQNSMTLDLSQNT